MNSSDQSQRRTRMFARAFGPFFTIVPAIVAARATTQMPVLLREFAGDPMWQWVLGAALLLWGSVIIAFHQYWRSVAAVLVSLLGWFLAIRGCWSWPSPIVTTRPENLWRRTIFRWSAPCSSGWP